MAAAVAASLRRAPSNPRPVHPDIAETNDAPRAGSRSAALARFGATAALAAAGTSWLTAAQRPEWIVPACTWLVVGFLAVPLAFAAALPLAVAVLSGLLTVLAVPAWLAGRPTGLADVLADLWRLAGHVLPGYVRALRRVRQPVLWGLVVGFAAGVALSAAAGAL